MNDIVVSNSKMNPHVKRMKDIGLSNPKPIAGAVSAAGSAWSAP
jgi:hypothetical protein